MNNIRFRGVMPALVTPFDASTGKVNEKCVRALMSWHIEAGMKGFYVCGSTGEGPALRVSTRKEITEIAVEQARGKGDIIVHVGAPSFEDAVELTRHATKAKASAISSLAPTYSFKYSDDELVEYYRAIAGETDLPVLVYATAAMGTPSFPRLMKRLIDIPNVIGVKFTIRDYFEMGKTKEVNGGDINVINGPDETLLCGLSMGADGGIGSTYNLLPSWFVELYDAFMARDILRAQECQRKINRVITVLLRYSGNGAIKGTKAALRLMGYDCGGAVFPAGLLSKQELDSLAAELRALGVEL